MMFMLNLNSSLSDDDHVRFNLKQNYKPYNTTQSNTRLLSRNVGVSLVSIARLPSGSVSTGTGLSAQRAVHVESLTVSGTARPNTRGPWLCQCSAFVNQISRRASLPRPGLGGPGRCRLPPLPADRRPRRRRTTRPIPPAGRHRSTPDRPTEHRRRPPTRRPGRLLLLLRMPAASLHRLPPPTVPPS